MDMFARGLAPISSEAWKAIDDQAVASLRANLSARRFVDVKGPKGWDAAAIPTGHLAKWEKAGNIECAVRESVSLVESRIAFELPYKELFDVERGAGDPDLDAVEEAARIAAAFEDKVVYEGFAQAGVKGLKDAKGNKPVVLPKADPEAFLRAIVDAVSKMRVEDSIEGPYALVGGKSLREALGKLVSGRSYFDVVKNSTEVDEYIFTPSCDCAYLVSKRGGDFELTLGGDFTIGYTDRQGDLLRFFLTESLTFRILEPRACTPLALK
jgi:Uncharacterized protein, linocin/CFP29 homolog